MSWLSFAIISLITLSLAAIAQTVVSKRSKADALTLSMLYAGLTRVGLIFYALSIGSVNFAVPKENWQLILLNMILSPIATILTFKGLKRLDVSLHIIVFSSAVLYTVIGSTIILDESINSVQWVGLGLILSGVVLAHSRGKESKNVRTGLAYTMLAAVFYGAAGVVDKLYFDRVDLTNFFIFGSGGTALGLLLMYIVHQKYLKRPLLPKTNSVYWRFVGIGALLLLLSTITEFLALQKLDNIAHLTAIRTFSVVLTIIFGIVLLRERKHLKIKLFSGAIATIGFLLLI